MNCMTDISIFSETQSRFDTESLTNALFSDVTKLYNAYEEKGSNGNWLNYPARIASIGKIGPQPFLIIGDMPSYYQSYDGVKKKPSSPEPKDFEFQLKMLQMGERLGLPLVYFCDTPGAKPTLESERIGQSRMIAEVINANNKYPHPVITVVTGMLGSGGGLTAAPIGEHRIMLSNALATVAEPRSATSILYSKANPTIDEIKTTLSSMRATAEDQLDLKLIDAVVHESSSVQITAQRLYEEITQAFIKADSASQRRRMANRRKRIRDLRGIPIKK